MEDKGLIQQEVKNHGHRCGERRTVKVTPDDGLFDGVIEGHEELRVLPNAAHKVADKHVQAVGRRGLDPG